VRGALWSDPSRAEASLEVDFAEDLGAGLGTVLTLDVLGVPIDVTVTSVREVEWRTFGINFFVVVEPGVMEGVPHQRLATARLPRGSEGRVQDALVAAAPNVTLVPIREVLERVAQLLARVASGVRLLGAFGVLAGTAILVGAVAAGAARRRREVALLRALGMTGREVARLLAVEHALLGSVAAVVGAAGALLISWIALVRGMELPFEPSWTIVAAAIAGTVVLASVAGVLASWTALRTRPIEALRAGS
jgi:putative ABC transport system permease protein